MADEIQTLKQAVALSPDNAPLRRHLGDVLAAVDRHEEAVQEYKAALALEPSDELRLDLAREFLALGKTGEAAVLVDVALEADEGSAPAHVLRARLLLNEGDLEGARDAYRRAVALDPGAADGGLAQLLVAPEDELDVTPSEAEFPPPAAATSEAETLTFADVGGMEDVKEEIRRYDAILDYLGGR